MRRTAITRLEVTDEQRDLLEETISEWKRGCQIATDMAWGKCNAKSDVQPLAYDDVREETDLGSQHAILATHQAAQAITGCLERDRLKNGGSTAATPRHRPIAYDTRTFRPADSPNDSAPVTGSRS